MVNFASFLFVLAVGIKLSESKVFGNCELAQQLLKHGIPRSQIPTWVCIAKHESELDTSKINYSTGDHGIFQISQLFWCNAHGDPGKACKRTCADFRNDYIGDDIACVRDIYQEHQRLSGNGFNAWVVYRSRCNGDTSQYTRGCF